jgi:hypothetical protein
MKTVTEIQLRTRKPYTSSQIDIRVCPSEDLISLSFNKVAEYVQLSAEQIDELREALLIAKATLPGADL